MAVPFDCCELAAVQSVWLPICVGCQCLQRRRPIRTVTRP